jgi:precorrin-6B methylase 2
MRVIKKFIRPGRRPRTVRWGLYRGITLQLDLHCEFQNYFGLYECETFSAIRSLAEGCRGFLDLGAAKGELSIYFLRRREIERIVAVEPSDDEIMLFQSNLVLNAMQGDSRLHIHHGFAGEGESGRWKTLDELGASLPSPMFMKIDIDGPEAEVLQTGLTLLRDKDCRLLIETHSLEAESGCLKCLKDMGYTTEIINPASWRRFLPEHRPIKHNRWLTARRT